MEEKATTSPISPTTSPTGRSGREDSTASNLSRHITTNNVLLNFVRDRSTSTEFRPTDEKRRRSVAATAKHQDTLENLKKWAIRESSPIDLWSLFDYKSWHFRSVPRPSTDDLVALAEHYFPPRPQTMVQVFDFGMFRAEHQEIPLGEIEKEMKEKPDWADVRWIHLPLGTGLFHSSFEDVFYKDKPKGRPFERAGREGWPMPETEMLTMQSKQHVKDMQLVACLLTKQADVTHRLNQRVFDGDKNETLRADVEWRRDFTQMDGGFWESVLSDIPWQLSQGVAIDMSGPGRASRTIDPSIETQAFAKNAFFEESQLTRVPFRTFHRGDGFLLTQSPSNGIDFLNKNFAQYLSEPADLHVGNSDASAVAQVFRQFAETGTSTWPRRTVEWLLVYLITEISITPTNLRSGHTVPSITEAYEKAVHQMKKNRYAPWKRYESVALVREFLACIDELAALRAIVNKKLDFLERLEKDCERFDAEDEARGEKPNPNSYDESVSWTARTRFAASSLKRASDHYERLLNDLNNSLNSLFQLRSIEQNELAVISDSQNKALFVFTGVTVVFLPLSFFTSYYGMNLAGIANTTRTEGYFWKVCGSITLGLILLITFLAFRHKVRSLAVKNRVDHIV